MNIAVFAGSTSTKSINKSLATYAAQQLKTASFNVFDLNNYTVPIFSEDKEREIDYPEGATNFDKVLQKNDAFIVSLAEHNGSYTAAFKNLLDWISRKNTKLFRNKPVLLMATSPGARGAIGVLSTAEKSFPNLGAKIVASFSLAKFHDNFIDNKIVVKEKNNELKQAVHTLENAIKK
ncbi:MAG: NADPH-dependent FMN reductase [Tenacibaculum sp.]